MEIYTSGGACLHVKTGALQNYYRNHHAKFEINSNMPKLRKKTNGCKTDHNYRNASLFKLN